MATMRGVLTAFGVTARPSRVEQLVAFLVRWAILAFAVWVAASVVRGIYLNGWESTVVVALILGLLNMLLKPILFLISLPITVLTLGLFLLILNTAILALTITFQKDVTATSDPDKIVRLQLRG